MTVQKLTFLPETIHSMQQKDSNTKTFMPRSASPIAKSRQSRYRYKSLLTLKQWAGIRAIPTCISQTRKEYAMKWSVKAYGFAAFYFTRTA